MNTNWLYDTNSEVNAIKYSEVDHVVRHDIPTNKQKMSTNQVQIGKKNAKKYTRRSYNNTLVVDQRTPIGLMTTGYTCTLVS